uniref:Carbonic anhydrase n=1 Tax=Arion vulgaris TaxID=1028688 RepID=A0A0B6ZX98_9EUPU
MATSAAVSIYSIRSAIIALFLMCLYLPEVDADAVSWNYKAGESGGPEKWHAMYPDCGGVVQSPIDIQTKRVLYDPGLELFDFADYHTTSGVQMELENVGGHTAEVLFSGKEVFLKGGSLPNKYKLEQFHFHWGQDERRGSEHGLNGQHFPMEAHFVHSQYGLTNTSKAAEHPFGLAVVGFFFKIGKKNEQYEQLLKYFKNITEANQKIHIPTFPVIQLLPTSARLNYYRYQGSLTTPPCYESVIWSVAEDLIEISEDQINKFRGLFDEESHQLVNDFRPVQNLNQRTVLSTSSAYRDTGRDSGSIVSPQITMLVLAIVYHVTTLF